MLEENEASTSVVPTTTTSKVKRKKKKTKQSLRYKQQLELLKAKALHRNFHDEVRLLRRAFLCTYQKYEKEKFLRKHKDQRKKHYAKQVAKLNEEIQKEKKNEDSLITKVQDLQKQLEEIQTYCSQEDTRRQAALDELSAHWIEYDRNNRTTVEKAFEQKDYEIKQCQQYIQKMQTDLSSRIATIYTLEKDKKDLTLRLSKLAGANLTYNNPNIADLSDENRPTKLAEDFSELYDNEWTDAFEVIPGESEKLKTQFMLNILKRVSQLCNDTSRNHMDAIKKSLSSLVIRDVWAEEVEEEPVNSVPAATQREETNTFKTYQQKEHVSCIENDTSLTIAEDTEKSCNKTSTEPTRYDNVYTSQQTVDENAEDHMESNACGRDRTDDCYFNKKRETFDPITLTMDFEELTNDQKKTVIDIRKYFENKHSNAFIKVGSDIIAKENGVDQQAQACVVTYIEKCMKICWSMCKHDPPVHIDFPQTEEDLIYDSNMFKPYTKTGKHLDFVVWPALYLHKNGPMLAKGVAQGRN